MKLKYYASNLTLDKHENIEKDLLLLFYIFNIKFVITLKSYTKIISQNTLQLPIHVKNLNEDK